MKTIFWTSFLILFYSYGGYLLFSMIFIMFKKHKPKSIFKQNPENLPSVSLIIAAYNEESTIQEKIDNCFNLIYPKKLLEIIFITDGSTDSTPEKIKRYSELRLLHQIQRSGKPAAINRAVPFAKHEILVFCDANTFLNPESILFMVNHYEDPKVGGVSGEKKIRLTEGSVASGGEGIYWKYESLLKKMDSKLYSVIGAAGELFSVRRALFEFINPNTIIDDFVISLKINLKGYRIIYEPKAFAEEYASSSISEERKRKYRISAGAFQAMGLLPQLWNFTKYPLLTFLYFSHRVLRWTLCPIALFCLLFCNFFIWNSSFYGTTLIVQIIFYLLALVGFLSSNQKNIHKIFYVPFYFLFMNYAVIKGFILFLTGQQSSIWEKSNRIQNP